VGGAGAPADSALGAPDPATASDSATATAIERSVRWNLGANELGARMVLTEPYPWIYRSIERVERAPRIRRYLRGVGPPPTSPPPPSQRLRINRECRSYHLGWVLYAWSDPARRAQLQALIAE
jgi:hypothetical protein